MGRGEKENRMLNLGPSLVSATEHVNTCTDIPALTPFPHLLINGVGAVSQQDPFHFQHSFVLLPLTFQMATF